MADDFSDSDDEQMLSAEDGGTGAERNNDDGGTGTERDNDDGGSEPGEIFNLVNSSFTYFSR